MLKCNIEQVGNGVLRWLNKTRWAVCYAASPDTFWNIPECGCGAGEGHLVLPGEQDWPLLVSCNQIVEVKEAGCQSLSRTKILPGHMHVCPWGHALHQLLMPLPEFPEGREMETARQAVAFWSGHPPLLVFPNLGRQFPLPTALCYFKVSWK